MLLGVRDAREFLVEPSPSARADVLALSGALEEPGTDLESSLRELGASCVLAVASCVGFSITLVTDGTASDVTLLEAPMAGREIVTSVTIPLSGLVGVEPGAGITLYACRRGDLVDFAADLGRALRVGPDDARVDRHLTPDVSRPGSTGLAQVRERNQALGVLLERGLDLEQGRVELHRLAQQARTTPEIVAQRLIHATSWPPDLEPT